MKIELNELFLKSLNLMEKSNKNIFITGKAGTGKSTLLQYFRDKTKKKVVVLAPTGVAAINVNGETIHSFFRFKPGITPDKVKRLKTKDKARLNLYQKIDIIIIDEISMVRADLLDCMDKFLRINRYEEYLPFGGLQIIFIGDLYQLPPVVMSQEKNIFNDFYRSPYFFDAHVFKELSMEFIELEKIYRQKDDQFIRLLNSIRNKTAGFNELEILNSRYAPDYEPKDDYSVFLTTTNAMATEINQKQLARLKGDLYTFTGKMTGDFDEKSLPTDLVLPLKNKAQIMLLNNDSQDRWVNGTIGKIQDIKKESILVELSTGAIEEVTPFKWELFHFYLDEFNDRLETEPIGTFTQYPLRLAWAITIHKSQGKSFEQVIIDIGRGIFAHGQMYVALSRCRSLSGIILKKKITKSHIWMDRRVVDFVTQFQYQLSERDCSLVEKTQILHKALESGKPVEIIYLKSNDEKSRRIIYPQEIGEMEYQNKKFMGMKAYCDNRKEGRVFRLDRILALQAIESNKSN